jgi:hypothetical protein
MVMPRDGSRSRLVASAARPGRTWRNIWPTLRAHSSAIAPVACLLEEGSISFLKKRNKKLLSVSGHADLPRATRNGQNFFGSFFQKRTAFLALAFADRESDSRV